MKFKKCLYYHFSVTAISLLFCVTGYGGGQESHGGDGTALEFVKIGQALKVLLQRHPDWKISKTVSPRLLEWSINNTFVATGASKAVGVPELYSSYVPEVIFAPSQVSACDEYGNIFIHTPLWHGLSCKEKIKEVFHLYLEEINIGKTHDSADEISSLLPDDLSQGRPCFNFFQGQDSAEPLGFSNLPIDGQVKVLRHNIIDYLNAHPRSIGTQMLSHSPFKGLKNPLMDDDHTNIISAASLQSHRLPLWLREKDIVTFADDGDYKFERDRIGFSRLPNQDPETRCREMQLATGYFSHEHWSTPGIYIWINEKRWATFSYDQKFELIFHEYLNLFTTLDLYYRVTSTLFLR